MKIKCHLLKRAKNQGKEYPLFIGLTFSGLTEFDIFMAINGL
jgi:hypothetical protein